jgi:hypothetical protein
MKRVLAALAVAAVLGAGFAPAADASLTSNTFGSNVKMFNLGRVAQATAQLNCTSGQVVQFRVTLTQNDSFAEGFGGFLCNGSDQSQVINMGVVGGALDAGSADLCGVALNHDGRTLFQARQWCRTVTVSS